MRTIVDGLNSLGWKLPYTKASFYIWARVPKGYTSASFVSYLLEHAGILVVPGSGYGMNGEGYFRISITIDKSRLVEAVTRMKKAGIIYK
jgi:LL-diaminopimelate aminotransferase